MQAREIIEKTLGVRPARVDVLPGGCVATVVRADLPDGARVVAKLGDDSLGVEAFMLRFLAEHTRLPVPRVVAEGAGVLVMEYVEGSAKYGEGGERHAAELLADLHGHRAERFGFERDTLIGGLPQPNPRTGSWLEFFGKHRLIAMARQAGEHGRIPEQLVARVERLAGRLDRWLEEPEHPSLVHGDVWSGNVLARLERIKAFLDPAIYYGHSEVELAFIALFGTFGDTFFRRYHELRPIRPGFESRRDLYNLYPLLVHARLFGGSYAASAESILSRFER